MGAQELTALVSAVVALGAAVVSGVLSARASRTTARFQHELEQQRRHADKEQLVDEVMTRYREPLLRAAFDLQSRIFNVLEQRFLMRYHQNGTLEDREYAETSTMFVFAEYLGWVEILRRGVQFLDLGDVDRNRQLAARLEGIGSAFLGDGRRELRGQDFRIFRAQQRALGELMIEPVMGGDAGRGLQCMGFATFAARLDREEFARWFEPLRQSTRRLAAGDDTGVPRLRLLQHELIDMIDFLDPDNVRFPAQVRRRL